MTHEVSGVLAFCPGYSLHATGEGNKKSSKCDFELNPNIHAE